MPRDEQAADETTPAGQFAAHLRAVMERQGKRGVDVAEAMGVDKVTVSRWTTGRRTPSLEQCDAIAKALGLASWWDLFQRD